jgi:hypothetical protein
MIDGLMTRAEFENATRKSNPFARRSSAMKEIGVAIDDAHAAPVNSQFSALLGVSTRCYRWKVNRHERKPGEGWEKSGRALGVTLLETQVAGLLAGPYNQQYHALKRSTSQHWQRAGEVFKGITGVGDASRGKQLPNRTKALSGEDYYLEFIEPSHRANASQMLKLWKDENPHNLPFADFVRWLEAHDPAFVAKIDEMNGKLQDKGFGVDKHVYYLNEQERPGYELTCPGFGNNGWRRSLDEGRLFHSGDHSSDATHSGWSIFVMDHHNHIYTHSKIVKQFHHSSFLAGRPTKSAGTLCVDRGKILAVTMASGHYAPSQTQALNVCLALLVKMSGNQGRPNDLLSGEMSARARNALADIKICPDFQYHKWFNALAYTQAGGTETGLTTQAPPPTLHVSA